jgi:hypothetical protein
VARYADACNLFGEPDVVAAKVDLRQQLRCEAGRNLADVEVTQLLSEPDSDALTDRVMAL